MEVFTSFMYIYKHSFFDMFRILLLFICVALFSQLHAQEVSISPEISLRNYFAYEILGDVDGKSIVFRDKGYVKECDVFNRELEKIQSAELIFEKKRVDVFSVETLDSVFQILYGYFEKDSMVFKMRLYDNKIRLVDSTVFMKLHKRDIRKRVSSSVSQDRNRILLSTVDQDEGLVFLLYNSKLKDLEWFSKITITGEYRNNLNDILLANNGDFLLLLNENMWNTKPEKLTIAVISPRYSFQKYVNFDMKDLKKANLHIDYDNLNDRWLICGTYSEKKQKEAEGYFYVSKSTEDLKEKEFFNYLPFAEDLHTELLQGRKRKNRVLEDLSLQEVIFRQDGGFIFISELEREYMRRNPYNSYARSSYDNYSGRAWVDFYNDDIIVSSIDPEGKMDWNKVLYKKQFSQDDDGIFSSFFVLKTPSRLRFIYNDEIKKNNTVSEYLMDPNGKIARNSLLSTAYQKMKLRFRDAIQTGPNSMIVPSERNYDLNLVRITY